MQSDAFTLMQGQNWQCLFHAQICKLREVWPLCCNTPLIVRHTLLRCVKYAHIRRKDFSFRSLFELVRDTPTVPKRV